MKKQKIEIRILIVLFIFSIAIPFSGWAQNFFEPLQIDRNLLNTKSQYHLDFNENKSTVAKLELVSIDVNSLDGESVILNFNDGVSSTVTIYHREEHSNGIRSVFGLMEDLTSIYFTIDGSMLISKFYRGHIPYTILPLEGNIHMMMSYNDEIDNPICGNLNDAWEEVKPAGFEKNDNGCNIRILIAYSDDAVTNIAGNLHLHAQSVIDESNQSFNLSGVGMRFEIATVRVFNMVEDPTVNTGNCRSNDLQSFFDNDPPFGNVDIFRGNYRSDLQILIVNQDIGYAGCGGGTLFGQVIAVGVNDDNAYAISTLSGIDDGRFTFTHELGHIMGARHENDGSNYNRGYVFDDTGANRLRTIMARTGASQCDQANSCRVQYWSNPDITIGGDAIGVDDEFDNSRWLDEQDNNVRNYRENWGSVTINPETIANNVMGNYSANSNITTSGAVVVNSGGNLTFRAGTAVNINNGFTVNNGGRFGVVLGGCTTNVPRSPLLDKPGPDVADTKINVTDFDSEFSFSVRPNPLSDFADVEFSLRENQSVKILLSDINGRVISVLMDEVDVLGGNHSLRFRNQNLPTGIYYLSILTNEVQETIKLAIVDSLSP